MAMYDKLGEELSLELHSISNRLEEILHATGPALHYRDGFTVSFVSGQVIQAIQGCKGAALRLDPSAGRRTEEDDE